MKMLLTPDAAKESADEAASKTPQQLLRDIYVRVNDAFQDDSAKGQRLLADFSALMVAISKESADTAEKNLKIQNRLILLTILILILTAVSVVQPAYQLYQNLSSHDAGGTQTKHLDGVDDKRHGVQESPGSAPAANPK